MGFVWCALSLHTVPTLQEVTWNVFLAAGQRTWAEPGPGERPVPIKGYSSAGMPKVLAASPSVIPAKNRSFTGSAAAGNSFASRLQEGATYWLQ